MSEFQEIGSHLEELRTRMLRVVIVIGAITVFVITFHMQAYEVAGTTLYYPVPDPLNNMAAQITQVMRGALLPEDVDLIQTAPGEAFFAQVYIAALVGIAASMPLIVRESVSFLRPALKENEISVGRTITVPALGLFVAGSLFSVTLVTPYILEFLYGYGESAGVITFLNVIDFVTFVLQFLLAFGVSFQLPLIMYVATASGITDSAFWRRNVRYAVVILVIFGAAITPDGTGVTMWLIAGPMIGLYLAGMFLIERRERKAARKPA